MLCLWKVPLIVYKPELKYFCPKCSIGQFRCVIQTKCVEEKQFEHLLLQKKMCIFRFIKSPTRQKSVELDNFSIVEIFEMVINENSQNV